MHSATPAAVMGDRPNVFRRAEAWLDDRGRPAWIAAMVLGFVFFWPVGLALVAYITITNRWSKSPMFACAKRRDRHFGHNAYRPSGNSAFDNYKTEVLKRLEDEQTAFEDFLQRLRDAKDKQEFDAFMADRAQANRTEAPRAAAEGEVARPGEY